MLRSTRGMEPLAPSSFSAGGYNHAVGRQQQVRVDYVVNRITQTHRGQGADVVAQAIHDELRALGVVPNHRLIAQYAKAIAALPPMVRQRTNQS